MPDTATLLRPAAELARHDRRYPNETAEYRAARTALLAEEIELRRHIERVAERRRALPPGPAATGDYRFEGAEGELGLAGLFGDKDTLVTYSWMFGPERARPCPMCTSLLSAWEGEAEDLGQRVALAVIARSPYPRMAGFAAERGWRRLRLYSDLTGDFSRDYHALAPAAESGVAEGAALNVFTRRDGVVRLFWAEELGPETADPGQDPRGAPDAMPLWTILDCTPDGRGADWYPKLNYAQQEEKQ